MGRDRLTALAVFLAYTAAAMLAGFLLAEHFNKPVPQVYAPEVRTAPNDLSLETKPGSKPTLPAPSKPRGGKVVSTTEVHVSGQKPVSRVHEQWTSGPQVSEECKRVVDSLECPPLDLRLDMIEVNGQQYMAVRSPDGTEVTGQFLPNHAVKVAPDKRLTLTAFDGGGLLTLSKDYGHLSAGVAAGSIDGKSYAGLSAGFAWR